MAGHGKHLADQSRQAIEQGSRSFALASLLFTPDMQRDAHMLYAWCRHCDDVIDGQNLGFFDGDPSAQDDTPEAMQARLAHLQVQTIAALNGEPVEGPEFAAFQQVALAHDMPHQHPLDLLEGFRMDATDYQYTTLQDTLDYCYHVAGVVGVMMAIIMGVDRQDEETLHRAADLGIAFQLTNIARDIVDDAKIGRVYVPADWLEGAGVPATPDGILDETNRDMLAQIARRLLKEADRYYDSAGYGLRRLPWRAAAAVAAARSVYRDIGRLVRQRGPAAWNRRASTSKPRKIWCAGKGLTLAAGASLNRRRALPERGDLWTRTV
ncbi:phytoene/squalene synthase family protein [Aquisalinus flavus]|uniref:Phytoene synthase n=1 Tax=Aquisalinus flavus TaxID=1526572 RepID=A0A8J2V3N9_9PROT|nr:phytoene/squalene synthase family protein [Aquisalinus flavus]MBD0427058.1 phytoene/squalene synthase family protein [Aquisalinus flavus]UNE46884.1 phytoene/squalene synthase family protein [Aquisalinus flavus]GGC98052.1 phytoene synthase [Aquisalinus flavus]